MRPRWGRCMRAWILGSITDGLVDGEPMVAQALDEAPAVGGVCRAGCGLAGGRADRWPGREPGADADSGNRTMGVALAVADPAGDAAARDGGAAGPGALPAHAGGDGLCVRGAAPVVVRVAGQGVRSEEHTSELQSQSN